MKLITAIIQPEALEDVLEALDEEKIHLKTVSNVLGCGRQKGHTEVYRGRKEVGNLLKKVRLDIAVNDNFADATIKAITKAARTGNIGDGKIFVVDLEACVRIRTGETGPTAIG
ncbi:MAG TPA: P-II family nitrogen regulator [Candidatus Omnitrophota bacterium]|nr:P-II family nitrogen regulator [Candidatus Omnitrophota bacterium]HPS21114.1 P-II family nitrogen regulator [Candidatus Omnitrophota bacterium]